MSKTSKTIKVVTMGDSLTQGGVPPEYRIENPNLYQAFLYQYLKNNAGINADIWNLGIGGQTMGQIIARVPTGLPTDIITILGGTNDIWHFLDAMKGYENEIIDGIIEELTSGIKVIKAHPGCKNTIIIACSIPPVGDVKTAPLKMADTINLANQKIEALCKATNVRFCDVNKAMRTNDAKKHAIKELVVADGVHFTPAGNKACGEAIAKCISNLMKGKS